MSLVRYFLRKGMLALYGLAAAVIALVFSLCIGDFAAFLRLFPMVLCILLLLRGLDDLSDYEKDAGRKTQHLTKRGLLVLCVTLTTVFMSLHLLCYGILGLWSIAAVGYFLLMQRISLCKVLCMALLFLYYFCMEGAPLVPMRLAVLLGCAAFSLLYHILKARKHP